MIHYEFDAGKLMEGVSRIFKKVVTYNPYQGVSENTGQN